MTADELEELRADILSLKAELEGTVTYLTGESKAVEPDVAIGRLTRMEAINEKSVSEAMLAKSRLRLEKLGNALDRLEQGRYGKCVRCGKEIPFGRLKILPESLLCLSCAEKKTGGANPRF
jgi:DnaK suppressor protein